MQTSIEGIGFLDSGYSVLATADSGTVLAAPTKIWNRTEAAEETTVRYHERESSSECIFHSESRVRRREAGRYTGRNSGMRVGGWAVGKGGRQGGRLTKPIKRTKLTKLTRLATCARQRFARPIKSFKWRP